MLDLEMPSPAFVDKLQRNAARLIAGAVLFAANPSFANGQDGVEPQEGAEESAYVDRLIDQGNLEPSLRSAESDTRSNDGNLRSLVVELSGAQIGSTSNSSAIDTSDLDRTQKEGGIFVSGRYQTDNLGLVGVDAQLRRGSRLSALSPDEGFGWDGLIELTSRQLPLGSGWSADSAIGMTNTPSIDMLGRQTRFFVPNTPILGGSVKFDAYRAYSDKQSAADPAPFASLNFSVGEPGLLGGLRLTEYTGLSGMLVSGGGQIELARGWTAGIQAIAVDDTQDPFRAVFQNPDGDSASTISSRAMVGSMGYSKANFRVQANTVWSTRSGDADPASGGIGDGSAFGASLDLLFRKGRSAHTGGLYYFGPGLTWGASAILSNAYGGFYRFSTSSQRWRWTFSVDALDSVARGGTRGIVVNADSRRNISFSGSVGANASLRFANGQTAGQVLGYLEFDTAKGTSRAELGWSKDRLSNLYRIGFIQNWSLPPSMPAGSRLSTQVSYQRRTQTESVGQILHGETTEKVDSFGVAVSTGFIPFTDATIDATLSYSSDASANASEYFGHFQSTSAAFGSLVSQQQESFSASVVASARLSPRVTLSGTYTDVTASLISRFGIPIFGSPLGPSDEQLDDLRRSAFRLQAAYLTLRYSLSAGRPAAFVGARTYPVGGVGTLEGRVFLDDNDNGVQDPAEVGVQGIIVILDGMQAVRSDADGRYRFNNVADGTHRVTVDADNLPLPWIIETAETRGLGQAYTATVEIGVRSVTTLDIWATRL